MPKFQFNHIEAENEDELVAIAVRILSDKMSEAIGKNGDCVLALSGGQTPQPLYEAFGRSDVDWQNVKVVLADERYVPADHEYSNQKLVRQTLLKNVSVGAIVFPDTSLPIMECVADYERRLPSHIDVAVLGMGGDGHIASLFPGDIGALTEKNRRVLHTTTDVFAVRDRITVTMLVLRDADLPVFFLKGGEKRAKFNEVMSSDFDIARYPAHGVLECGKTVWVTMW